MSNWCKLKGIYCSMTTINGYCQVTTCMHKGEPTSICNDAEITAGYGSVSWSDYKTGTSCDSVVLPTIKAIPVEYIKAFKEEVRDVTNGKAVIEWLLENWEKDNE